MTFEEYKEIGGVLDEPAFNRYNIRAVNIINTATHNRITDDMCEINPLTRDLIEYLESTPIIGGTVSHSAGSVSESVTSRTATERADDLDNILYDYLGGKKDSHGTPLLYRGCLR